MSNTNLGIKELIRFCRYFFIEEAGGSLGGQPKQKTNL